MTKPSKAAGANFAKVDKDAKKAKADKRNDPTPNTIATSAKKAMFDDDSDQEEKAPDEEIKINIKYAKQHEENYTKAAISKSKNSCCYKFVWFYAPL